MKRDSGILMPVFSLPGGHGIGDFGPAARDFIDSLQRGGCSRWQILPLNPGNPDNGESPYFSISAYAVNPLLISLEMLRDEGLLSTAEISAPSPFPPDRISYAAVRTLKMPLLEKAAKRLGDDNGLDVFYKANRHWLDDFALFSIMRSTFNKPWVSWETAYRDRQPEEMTAFARAHEDELRTVKILQYFAMTQWSRLRAHAANKGIDIIGDMPIYVALDSADTWSAPGLFKLDDDRRPRAVSGVPPDYFSATGQLWNNPVYDWEAHRRDRFSWWVGRTRHLFSLYNTVRIDHFRGLVQYWEIPAGEPTAINGAWMDVPTYELFDTLQSHLQPFPVLCEDLGIITDDVRAVMERYGFPGMKILQFAFGDNDPTNPYLPGNYTENCLVYTATHDNPPTPGWLGSVDHATMERILRHTGNMPDDKKEITWKLINLAMQSSAMSAIIPLQDILGLGVEARINDPAKLRGNWRWRWDSTRYPADAAFERLLGCIQKSGRLAVPKR